MARYPTNRAYRAGSASLPDGRGSPVRPPVPANDNTRLPGRLPPGYKPPRPANDPGRAIARAARGLKPAARGALRLGKIVPHTRVISTAWDVYQEYQRQNNEYLAQFGKAKFNSTGWTAAQVCFGAGTHISGFSTFATCGPEQVVAMSDMTIPNPLTNTVTEWIYVRPYIPGHPSHRFNPGIRWTRNVGNVQPASFAPPMAPAIIPNVNPLLDPFAQPVGVPAVQPRPLPYRLLPQRLPNPSYAPGHRREFGYGSAADAGLTPRPDTATELYPQPGPVAPTVRPERPPPGVKEKKFMLMSRSGAPFLYATVNAVTESADVIEAFWGALPFKYKGMTRVYNGYGRPGQKWASPPPHEQLLLVLRHWKHLDWDKVWQNLAINQIVDWIGGKGGQATKNLNQLTGSGGLSTGPTL